ncbi:uncharacterized protein LOC134283171 [Saccostrea cucullata]|uniref:uncharacterized protein LOC134283171 n=1 Tax=Saccostrea cuccullata TaxID=36930 RepID=UPI002ED3ED09
MGNLRQMFGSLSALSITTEEHGYTIDTPKTIFSPPVKQLLDEPKRIATIHTRFERLSSIICLNDEEFWTCGDDKFIKLYNRKGKLLKSIKAKSGNHPIDIAVTRRRNLIYIDYESVYEVRDEKIHEIIKINWKWELFDSWDLNSVCSTSSDDLLVILHNGYRKQTKVVLFSDYKEKQTIQFDSEGQPLYSSDYSSRNVCENRNLDICVADGGANAVIVVNQAGKLRFRYTGTTSATNRSFYVYGITSDSHSHILIADYNNHCIHILDQDGQLLCCIYNHDLYRPWALCLDARDNLYINERYSGIIRKIRYM